ncbi:MAG TPA: TIGR01777 family oxidoreductase [Flavobacterium sp.]|nr:TIGR01777 family oxidoreductase [Flavobacterium sp.]
MRVLITGATGLIGSELVSDFRARNTDIHYLSTSQKNLRNEPGYKGFFWDPARGIIDENCMMGVDVIIHLAGASIAKRWTQHYKQEIIESRIMSANLLYKTLKQNPHQVRQVVSASAIGIYPDSQSATYTEDDKTVDNSFLGHVVVKWEASVDKFKQLGLKVCKIRTGLVLSKKGGVLQELVKPIKLGIGSPYGSGKHWQSWIHIEDLTALYVSAVENQWEGVINAVAPNPVSNDELTRKTAKVLHKPFFMPHVPETVMKMMLGEMHQLLFASQKVSPKRAVDGGFKFKFPILDLALINILS